jgi:hypothetical protein
MKRRRRYVWVTVYAMPLLVALSAGVSAQTVVCPADLASRSLQSVIDEIPAGGILILEEGRYFANAVIRAPVTILGGQGVELRPEDPARAVITIRDTEGVSIRGLNIDHAPLGLYVRNASCSIVGCSMATSEMGMDFSSPGTHVLVLQDCTLRGQGVGIRTVGTGTALVSACHIEMSGPGILVAGMTTLFAVGCTVTRCSDGVVASFGANLFLHANTLEANMGSGLRLSEPPEEVRAFARGTVCATDNQIVNNIHWGIAYVTTDGPECEPTNRQVLGVGNTVAGNGYGDVCPVGFVSQGFFKVDEPD